MIVVMFLPILFNELGVDFGRNLCRNDIVIPVAVVGAARRRVHGSVEVCNKTIPVRLSTGIIELAAT